jgi:hypothetical protein
MHLQPLRTRVAILIILSAILDVTSSTPQIGARPPSPPDACYRRNDTLPACPYGGKCFPNQNYTCQTSCMNYQYLDSRFWCNINCGYKATTLHGDIAPNPLLCVQPTSRNSLKCDSGFACYRQFGTSEPFRTQGPVCSPSYIECLIGSETKTSEGNGTKSSADDTGCGTEEVCVQDPRHVLTRPRGAAEDVIQGICVPAQRSCSGKAWNECEEKEMCVRDTRCNGKLGQECKGLCVKVLGPLWGTVNGTDWTRYKRSKLERRC